jgi:hypothetical protein
MKPDNQRCALYVRAEPGANSGALDEASGAR